MTLAAFLVDLSSGGLVVEEWARRVDGLGVDGNGHRSALSVHVGPHRDVDAAETVHRNPNQRLSPTVDLGVESLDEHLASNRHTEVLGRGFEPVEVEVQPVPARSGPPPHRFDEFEVRSAVGEDSRLESCLLVLGHAGLSRT